VIGADGAVKAGIVEGLYNRKEIQGAVAGKMGGFLKIAGAVMAEVPYMGKVDPALQRPDNTGNIVPGVGPQAPGTQGHSVVGIIRKADKPEQFFPIRYNPGKSENRPCGIVGMNSHVDIIGIADRHDPLNKVL
jgi:hypothetical protein